MSDAKTVELSLDICQYSYQVLNVCKYHTAPSQLSGISQRAVSHQAIIHLPVRYRSIYSPSAVSSLPLPSNRPVNYQTTTSQLPVRYQSIPSQLLFTTQSATPVSSHLPIRHQTAIRQLPASYQLAASQLRVLHQFTTGQQRVRNQSATHPQPVRSQVRFRSATSQLQ